MKIFDISVRVGTESITYPGDTSYSRELIWSIKDSGICNLSKLEMSAHCGTHLDAPLHFCDDGKSIDQIPIDQFILTAWVVEISNPELITAEEINNLSLPIKKGEALLFKTINSLSGQCCRGNFEEIFVYLSLEAAELCVAKGAGLVGIDYVSIEQYSNNAFPSHHEILGNDTLILEGLNLKQVPVGKYTLLCLPLKLEGCEASPVRAILTDGVLK